MPSDTELLRRYVDRGDQLAFAELVQRNLGVIYNAALRRVNGNPHFAEEAAQVVFAELASKAHRLVHHSALLGWLHTSTRYAASAIVRRERRYAARQQTAMVIQPDNGPPADWESMRPLIDEALDHLDARDRQAILLRYFSQRSFAEIGRELRLSEDACRKRIDRALENLRRQFARRGVMTSATALAAAMLNVPAMAVPSALAGAITATATTTAASGASAATAASLVGFMATAKTSGITPVACSLLGFLAFGTAMWTWSALIEQERRQLDATWAQASEIRSRIRQLGQEDAAQRKIAGQSNATSSGQTENATPDWRFEALGQAHLLATSAAYAPFREQMFRLRAQREFGPFFEAHQYPSWKIDQVRRVLVRYYDAEEKHVLRLNSGTDDARQFKANLEEEREQFAASLRSTLEEREVEAINRCFAAQRALPRARVVSLELADAGAPLDRVQELSLAMILADRDAAAKSASTEARERARAVDASTGLSADDRAMLDDAAVFLSARQLGLYKHYLQQQHVLSALQERARTQVASAAPLQ